MAEQPLSERTVHIAKPTIRIDGQEHLKVTELMRALEMTEQEGGMSALELRVSNVASLVTKSSELAFEDDRILRLGAAIVIYGAGRGEPKEIFRGKITGLELEFREGQPPELTIMAEDVFLQARMSRRTKVWQNSSLADVASVVASQLNLTPVITGLTESFPALVQLNESDLAFLRRLLVRHDADMQVVGEELHVSARKDVAAGSIDLILGSQLQRVRAVADLANQVTEVTVTGWDYKQGSRIHRSSTGSYLQPGSGRAGADLLRDTIGPRSEHVGDPGLADDSEAQALADTIFDRRARPFVCVEATAQGNPEVRVGTQVNLLGLGGRFSNSYYVVRCCHKYDLDNGYRTDFEAECAFLGAGA